MAWSYSLPRRADGGGWQVDVADDAGRPRGRRWFASRLEADEWVEKKQKQPAANVGRATGPAREVAYTVRRQDNGRWLVERTDQDGVVEEGDFRDENTAVAFAVKMEERGAQQPESARYLRGLGAVLLPDTERYVCRFRIPSDSRPDQWYTVSFDTVTDHWTCSCKASVNRGTCKHTQRLRLQSREGPRFPVLAPSKLRAMLELGTPQGVQGPAGPAAWNRQVDGGVAERKSQREYRKQLAEKEALRESLASKKQPPPPRQESARRIARRGEDV